jgi:hypothetical protein
MPQYTFLSQDDDESKPNSSAQNSGQAPAPAAPAAPASPAASAAGGSNSKFKWVEHDDELEQANMATPGYVPATGAVVGAAVSDRLLGKEMFKTDGKIPATIDPNKPASRMALQNWLNSMLQQSGQKVKLPISELEKFTGTKIRTMGELGTAYAQIAGQPAERVAKTASIDRGTGQAKKIFTLTPGKSPIDLSAYAHNPTVASRVADKVLGGFDTIKGALPSVAKVGVGSLGGGLAALQGYEAYELAKKIQQDKENGIKNQTTMGLTDDEWRVLAKSSSALGGTMAMIPSGGLSQAAGLALQIPELGYQGYQGFKALQKYANTPSKEGEYGDRPTTDVMGGLQQ